MKIDASVRKQKVVVVGGSFAGLCAIRHLSKYDNVDLTLIEPKDYFEYAPGALHLLAGSGGDLISPIADIIQNSATVVRGKLFGLNDVADKKSAIVKTIDTDGGEGIISEIPYDAMIICTGVPYTAPIRSASVCGPSMASRLLEIDDFNDKLRNSTRVIISGGGLVGVELAAEISCRLKDEVKEVLLISRSNLLGSLPDAAGQFALQWLKRRKNVKLFIGDEISGAPFKPSSISSSLAAGEDEPGTTMSYKTRNGQILTGDLFIDCTGQRVNVKAPSEAGSSSSAGSITSSGSKEHSWPYETNGLIAVDSHLMALKHPKAGLFAAGDVVEHFPGVGFACSTQKSGLFGSLSSRPSVRNAHLAESQAELVATNVARYLSLSPSGSGPGTAKNMLSYPRGAFGVTPAPLLACVSLGPMHGIVVFNDLVLGGVLFSMLGGLAKYIVERSKMAEIRNQTWGRAFWAFGHVVVNALHVLHVRLRSVLTLEIFRRPKRKDDVPQASYQ